MKTANLTGALLDYWTARAEGMPADQLEIRATCTLCVRNMPPLQGHAIGMVLVLNYSTNWALAGPLVEKHVDTMYENGGHWAVRHHRRAIGATGDTPLIAICRAVVRAAFGDEVAHVCPKCSGEMRKSAAAGGWAPEGFTSELDHWYCDGCANVIMFDEVEDLPCA